MEQTTMERTAMSPCSPLPRAATNEQALSTPYEDALPALTHQLEMDWMVSEASRSVI